MCFEVKHHEFKRLAANLGNFTNLPYSLAKVIKKVYVTVFKPQRTISHRLVRKELRQDQVIFTNLIFIVCSLDFRT